MTTLLGYAAVLARTRGDAELAEWHDGWEDRLKRWKTRGRAAAAALGADPEAAIAPADESRVGRAGVQRRCRIRDRGRGDRPFTTRRSGPTPRNLKEFCSMSVDVVVAVPVFMDMTFVGLEGLPGLGEERFAGDLVRTPGGGAITAFGTARLGLRRRSPPRWARTRRAI